MINDVVKKDITFRLKLAQDILEDSDKLGGVHQYPHDEREWWMHPRHTTESLTIYLLLTCFDKLGQPDNFITFENWLKSRKSVYKAEVEAAIKSLPSDIGLIKSAQRLSEYHHSIYGVKKSFYSGIELIPEPFRSNLLSSIQIRTKPDFGKTPPNISTPSSEIKDSDEINRLRYKYLYQKRNNFTHDLKQYHSSSVPMMAGATNTGNAAWVVQIQDSTLRYWGLHEEYEPNSTVGAYYYSISNWPFVLFEAIYAAIGVSFHRTEIDLNFQVLLFNSQFEDVYGCIDDVPHSRLKNYRQLEIDYWLNYKNSLK